MLTIEELKQKLAKEINDLENEADNAKSELDDASDYIYDVQSNINDVENKVDDAKNYLDDVQYYIGNINSLLEEEIVQRDDEITALRSSLDEVSSAIAVLFNFQKKYRKQETYYELSIGSDLTYRVDNKETALAKAKELADSGESDIMVTEITRGVISEHYKELTKEEAEDKAEQ